MVALGNFLYTSFLVPAATIIEHPVDTNPDAVIKHWTAASMRNAIDADQQNDNVSNLTQGSTDISQGKVAQQQGQPPRNGNPSYPLSTVGKVFMTNEAGQDMACSGTAVASSNSSVVFPEPLGPIRPKMLPRGISREKSLNAWTVP